MQKTPILFDKRNDQKKKIEFAMNKKVSIRVGQFWWYREGINIGHEISKNGLFKRVCLVLNNTLGNGLILIMPLTTKYSKNHQNTLLKINNYTIYKLKESRGVLNQIKLIDQKRFSHISGTYIPAQKLSYKAVEKLIDLIKK